MPSMSSPATTTELALLPTEASFLSVPGQPKPVARPLLERHPDTGRALSLAATKTALACPNPREFPLRRSGASE